MTRAEFLGAASRGLGRAVAVVPSGNGPAVLAAAAGVTDDWDIHRLELLGLGDTPDTRDIFLWYYEKTACSLCREDTVRKLIERGQAPEALLRECLLDCVPDIREMAELALK